MEHGNLRVGTQALFRGHELEDLDPVERPAVRVRHLLELSPALGKCYVEPLFADFCPGEKELESERRFSGTRDAVNQIDVVTGKTPIQDLVQSGNARGSELNRGNHLGISHAGLESSF